MEYTELVKKLREKAGAFDYDGRPDIACDYEQAADAIEALSKNLERSKEWEAFWETEATEALKKFQTAVASMPRWIPTTERLPEDLKNVLVIDDGCVTIGHCEHYYGDEEVYIEWHDTLYYPIDPPYWMPLPETPKEET